MRTYSITITLTLLICMCSHAIDFTLGNSSKRTRDYTESEVSNAWTSDIACIKDGGRVVATSPKFQSLNLRKSFCASSELSMRKQAKLGISVKVFKAALLPTKYYKQVMGVK